MSDSAKKIEAYTENPQDENSLSEEGLGKEEVTDLHYQPIESEGEEELQTPQLHLVVEENSNLQEEESADYELSESESESVGTLNLNEENYSVEEQNVNEIDDSAEQMEQAHQLVDLGEAPEPQRLLSADESLNSEGHLKGPEVQGLGEERAQDEVQHTEGHQEQAFEGVELNSAEQYQEQHQEQVQQNAEQENWETQNQQFVESSAIQDGPTTPVEMYRHPDNIEGVGDDQSTNSELEGLSVSGYSLEELSADPQVAIEYKPAGFGRRSIATCIDVFLYFSLKYALLSVFEAVGVDFESETSGITILSYAVTGFLTLLVFYSPLYLYGQSLGKKLLKLMVVNSDGSMELGFLKIIWRESIAKFISFVFFGMGFLAIRKSKDRLAWHDKLARTKVVTY